MKMKKKQKEVAKLSEIAKEYLSCLRQIDEMEKRKQELRKEAFACFDLLLGENETGVIRVDSDPPLIFAREYLRRPRESQLNPQKLEALLEKKIWQKVCRTERVFDESKFRKALQEGMIPREILLRAMDEPEPAAFKLVCREEGEKWQKGQAKSSGGK